MSSSYTRGDEHDSARRVRDVSWISAGPAHRLDPYAPSFPPSDYTDYPTPATLLRPQQDLLTDDDDFHFDFSDVPQKHTGRPRWVGGFVDGLRRLSRRHKSPCPPPTDSALSLRPHHQNDPQYPTISSLNLRPLTPSAIAQTVELMDMPQPHLHYQPPPPPRAYPHAGYRSSPPAHSAPTDTVPQVLSTVDEHSNEQTGTQDTHPPPHSPAHFAIPNITRAPSHWKPATATVTDCVTVPPSSPSPPSTRFMRFLHNLDRLPWVESEQIVDPYFPGRSSRRRHHLDPDSPQDHWKPAASWYNNRYNPHPMPMEPSSATLLYGWPHQMPKAYSQPEMAYPQFPHGYAPLQPVFVYPTAIPPPATYSDIPRGAV